MKDYVTILADPPWRYSNRSGKSAPEHKRLHRYRTMAREQIRDVMLPQCLGSHVEHMYLWCPVPLIGDGLWLMQELRFTFKTIIVWHKISANGESDRRCMGFYFRVCTELLLFGVRHGRRTKPPWNVPNVIRARKREHSRKPDEQYALIERASRGPYLELFARHKRDGWDSWGDQLP